MKRVIALAVPLLIMAAGLFFFLHEPSVPHKKPSPDHPVHISIDNPQDTLLFLDRQQKYSSSRLRELISPVAYVVGNGIIHISGFLLLDIPTNTYPFYGKKDTNTQLHLFTFTTRRARCRKSKKNLLPYGRSNNMVFNGMAIYSLPNYPKHHCRGKTNTSDSGRMEIVSLRYTI